MTNEELGNKVATAVSALLDQIAASPIASVGSTESKAPGTYGSFSAKALRDLMESPIISGAFKNHLDRK